jgi:hypothetical protein
MLTKKVTISLTPEQQDKARSLSKVIFGKENISGFVGFLIERWEKEQHVPAQVVQCDMKENSLVYTKECDDCGVLYKSDKNQCSQCGRDLWGR